MIRSQKKCQRGNQNCKETEEITEEQDTREWGD
jgi:hypothetical protein